MPSKHHSGSWPIHSSLHSWLSTLQSILSSVLWWGMQISHLFYHLLSLLWPFAHVLYALFDCKSRTTLDVPILEHSIHRWGPPQFDHLSLSCSSIQPYNSNRDLPLQPTARFLLFEFHTRSNHHFVQIYKRFILVLIVVVLCFYVCFSLVLLPLSPTIILMSTTYKR